MKNNIKRSIEKIEYRTVEIIPENGLAIKLEMAEKEKRPLVVKLGVDPTAPDLHLGHAVVLRKLHDFQDLGHTAVLLIGDFTARIGDPSERTKTRPPLTSKQIEENAKTYAEQAFKILDRKKTKIECNGKWLSKLGFEDVVKLCAKFTVARILERDDFSKRYAEGKPISLHEFLYPVMQAYDSVALKADVELGGTDQKFNLLAGRQLQESLGQEPQVCITLPILEGIDGKMRMSKSLGNYIGVTEEPRQMFGKAMSIPDDAMPSWFRLASGLPEKEVEEIISGLDEGSIHPGEAKRRLAREIVKQYYGSRASDEAEIEFDRIFKTRGLPDTIEKKDIELTDAERDKNSIWCVKLVTLAGLAPSNREARSLINSGAVKLDGKKIASDQEEIPLKDDIVLQAGKKKFARIYFIKK